jgi:hypothetical protein
MSIARSSYVLPPLFGPSSTAWRARPRRGPFPAAAVLDDELADDHDQGLTRNCGGAVVRRRFSPMLEMGQAAESIST